jgi:HPt (histidine-containing phosphotransfer) domain-containing protein
MAPPQLDQVEIEMLRRLRNGSLLPQLLLLYRQKAGTQIASIKVAIAAGDAATLSEVAHSLKSASLSIGAKQIGGLCGELEALGRHGDTHDAAPILEELEQRFTKLLSEIEQYL